MTFIIASIHHAIAEKIIMSTFRAFSISLWAPNEPRMTDCS